MTRRRLAGWAMVLTPSVTAAALFAYLAPSSFVVIAGAITVLAAIVAGVYFTVEGWLRLHE